MAWELVLLERTPHSGCPQAGEDAGELEGAQLMAAVGVTQPLCRRCEVQGVTAAAHHYHHHMGCYGQALLSQQPHQPPS
jgi:hypothetical protein